jgi:hypothetical protein
MFKELKRQEQIVTMPVFGMQVPGMLVPGMPAPVA